MQAITVVADPLIFLRLDYLSLSLRFRVEGLAKQKDSSYVARVKESDKVAFVRTRAVGRKSDAWLLVLLVMVGASTAQGQGAGGQQKEQNGQTTTAPNNGFTMDNNMMMMMMMIPMMKRVRTSFVLDSTRTWFETSELENLDSGLFILASCIRNSLRKSKWIVFNAYAISERWM